MGDIADVFEELRRDVVSFVESLPVAHLQRRLPAAPEWTVRDVIAHLAGDADGVNNGDFPREFFNSFGDADAVRELNAWTANHVAVRKDLSLQEVLKEWDESAAKIVSALRGDSAMPENVPMFADRVLLTDLAVHQQDIFGAFGIE
ncbi:MAG: maleylpyruvate isomerase family mycothiol-dependent enzyme, partial [Actinomycetota bacterium]